MFNLLHVFRLTNSTLIFRLLLACLHFNENADRERLRGPDGKPKVNTRFPKYKKGEPSLAFVKAKPTYSESNID